MTSLSGTEALLPLRTDPGRSAVLFDIDGTLAPIVEHAGDATVPERTRQQLAALPRRYGLVACVSGRPASQARAMVSIGSITYLGSHGVELLRAGWTEPELDPELEGWRQRVREFADRVDSADLRRHRVRIEDKGPIVAFHWRGAPDERAAQGIVEGIAERATDDGLGTHWGRKVLEVRPAVRIDKGAGVEMLLGEAPIDIALYAGDDRTDLDAFRALRQLVEAGKLHQALLVGVSSEDGPAEITEEADLVVEGTEGVRELIAMLGE